MIFLEDSCYYWLDVGKTIMNHPPNHHVYMFTNPSHGWFMTLFDQHQSSIHHPFTTVIFNYPLVIHRLSTGSPFSSGQVRRVTTMDPSGVQAAAYQVTQQFWNLAGATSATSRGPGCGLIKSHALQVTSPPVFRRGLGGN